MKALVVGDRPGLEEVPSPELGSAQVRVKVSRSAITGLDRDVLKGRLPFRGIPGICFLGEVVEASDAEGRALMGRTVVGRGSYGCGTCDQCRAGLDARCVDRVRPGYLGVPGGLAEEIVLPSRAVLPVPAGVDPDSALLLPLLAGIWSAVGRVELPDWSNILIIGDGGMGLLAALAFSAAGYTVTVRGKHGNRFDLLRRHNVHFNLVSDEPEVRGNRPGRFGPALIDYPYVVEATGHSTGWEAATQLVSPGGTIFLLSSCADGAPRPLGRIQERNVHMLSLREGDLHTAAEILAEGLFNPSEVISSHYSLEEVLTALRRRETPSEWLPVIEFA